MDRNEIEEKVISYFHTILKRDCDITDQTDLNEDLHVTSFEIMSILACIEADFGAKVNLTDARNCARIGNLVDKVEEALG